MVEIRLHGPLAKAFGRRWELSIKSPAEAIQAIEANQPGIRKLIMDLARRGMVFRVRSKVHDYSNDDVSMFLGTTRRIDIIPIVRGASAGVRFVVGAVLVAIGTVAGPLAPVFYSSGFGLMFGAVTEWLTYTPKRGDESTEKERSWTLSGPTNTADQGNPVPVIYGEVLTGGYPISAAISAGEVNVGGTLDPELTLVGAPDAISLVPFGVNGLNPVQLELRAQLRNVSEPHTYTWTHTIAGGDLEVPGDLTVTGSSAPVFRAKAMLRLTANVKHLATTGGTVTLTVTGFQIDRPAGAPAAISVSQTIPVTLTVGMGAQVF